MTARSLTAGGAIVEAGAVHEIMAGLLRFIRERRFEPGERLPSERELAERFHVSRNTIREILATLEWFRFVERRPSSGVYLRAEVSDPSLETLVLLSGLGLELDEQEVLQSMETRYVIELQAIRLACRRRGDADLAHLDAILESTAADVRVGRNVADRDREFHLAIASATQNAVLVRVVKPFYLLSGKQREHYFVDRARAKRSLIDHRALREAIAARDEDEAVHRLSSHLGTVEAYWRSRLEKPAAR